MIDQLSTRVKKRLARTLLILARYGKQISRPPTAKVPRRPGEMIGTTRWGEFFLNKFRKLGFIEYNGKSKSIVFVVGSLYTE